MESMRVDVHIHHAGHFVRDGNGCLVRYKWGKVDVWPECDTDTLDVFYLKNFSRELGYKQLKSVYWLDPSVRFRDGIRELKKDGDLLEAVEVAYRNKGELHIYYEHPSPVVDPEEVDAETFTAEVIKDIQENILGHGDKGEGSNLGEGVVQEGDKGGNSDAVGPSGCSLRKQVRIKSPAKRRPFSVQKGKGKEAAGNGLTQNNGKGKKAPEGKGKKVAEGTSKVKVKRGRRHVTIEEDDSDEDIPEEVVGHRTTYATDNVFEGGVPSDNEWHSEELKTPGCSDDEDGNNGVFPQFNSGSTFGRVQLELGMEFNTLEAFKQGVRDYTICLGREIIWIKNDKVRARAKCKIEECEWEIFCAYSNSNNCFQIKTYNSDHTCGRTFKNNQASQAWVIGKLVKKLRKHPTMKHGEIYDYFKKKYGVQLADSKIWRDSVRAREIIEGSEKKQFGKLWEYCGELLRANPGSTIKMDTIPQEEGGPIFHRVYICLSGCKTGFKAGCRPLIGLDGAFLKGYYGGQLLSAVGQDANNHIWPIAYAVVDTENKDNWKWFLGLLHEDLGHYKKHKWHFISDMQKGLIPALQEVMPGAPHRFCVWHLWQNFNKQWKDKQLRTLLWDCARSTTAGQFNIKMQAVKKVNEKAWQYLDKWPKEAWTKAYFSDWPKVDNICNNNCEVFNSKIVNARTKPIISMLEEVRCYIMTTITTNKLKLEKHNGHLTPVQQSRLEKEKVESNKWNALWAGDEAEQKFEVQCWHTKVAVDLGNQTCSCRFWQLTGMSCMHAVAAISSLNRRPEDYCHHINPLQGEEYWQKTDQISPLPPPVKRAPGRPKKQRRKDGEASKETGKVTKLKRKLPDFTCSFCGGKKHNKKGCPLAKKQRLEELQAQQKNMADGSGPSTQAGPTDVLAVGTGGLALVAIGVGPTEVPAVGVGPLAIIGPIEEAAETQLAQSEEIDISQSQPPPLYDSPTKHHNNEARNKLPIRGKGKTAVAGSSHNSPPPTVPHEAINESSKTYLFMPTPSFNTSAP